MTALIQDLEQDTAVYKTLLESTRAIPWKIDWTSMRFAYIGPQIERLLGWTQASWISVDDWAQRMHPDDRERVVNFCVSQSQAGVDHEADYRALTASGEYVWIRDVVHVVRKPDGTVEALIGFMFDISERKKSEEKLAALQKELEELSFKDSLTGVANRRMFDTVMLQEWRSAMQDRQPLSLVMLDIDYFKQYNDLHGHLQGDECLKRVAQVLRATATGERNFLARFGGEEFVLVLPGADADAAHRMAERCRTRIMEEGIAHGHPDAGPAVTISIGCGTTVPARLDERQRFMEEVDRRLYRAKKLGRNRVVANA